MRALEPRRFRHLRSSNNKDHEPRSGEAAVALYSRSTSLGADRFARVLVRTSHMTPSLVSRSVAECRYERLCGDVLRPTVINLRLAPAFGPTVAM